jgi:hypothetical protein
MVHALLVLAAGESHSKTAFYVAGAALVAWGVLIAAFGLQRAEFPSSTGQQRGIIGMTVLLVAAAMATAVITA